MGKKSKVGKQRKDKFYHLAKETGYRSRSAFKLIQLNRKFEFLQKSKVLVDLCAAPGGWMQVAVEHMPVSSIVIGVDLFPIKPLAGCISIQEDITTPRCLQLVKKELKTWKVDVVLHDGAPNVGQNWIHDAYQQICLTLSAFKLATNILKPGGFFITKVFRSKDYNALLWILRQFFKNVYCTKPAASRLESAEIFVACKGYLAPDTIDPKFFDAKYVFEEIDIPEGKKQLQQLLTEFTKKKKPEGYVDGEALIYRPIPASEFIRSSDHIDLLANTSKIILDEDWIVKNAITTQDIKDYCNDVKVLGKKEIKSLITWRKILRDKLEQFVKLKSQPEETDDADSKVTGEIAEIDEDDSDIETKLEEAIAAVKDAELKETKKKRKKLLKDRKKIHDKTNLKMIIPGDAGPTDTSEDSLFTLKSMKTHADVDNLTEKSQMPSIEEDEVLDTDEELELFEQTRRSKVVEFDKEDQCLDSSGRYYTSKEEAAKDALSDSDFEDDDPDLDDGLGFEDDDSDMLDDDDDELDMDDAAPIASHPLITDLDPASKNEKRARKAQMWFDKDIFNDLNPESDEDVELNGLAEAYIKKGDQVLGYENKTPDEKPKTQKRKTVTAEVAPEDVKPPAKKRKTLKLDVEGLALGTVMIQSRKSKRDIMDDGWNRYAFNDPGLPDWFEADEKKHMRKAAPVPAQLVEDYARNLQEINARPIKKVVEAKARKKKRAVRKMERSKKKAEAILNQGELSETEKASQLKQLYKKAGQTKKKEVTYVVAKKFTSGKRARRPAGLKGLYKVVDPRMKKDMMRGKKAEAKGGAKGKRGAKSGRGGGGGRGRGRGRGR